MWTKAITVATCKECGDDIYPGDEILRVVYRDPDPVMIGTRVTLCEGCGKLYEESQEFGSDA